jgi:polyadenylation factor subunit 2
MKEIRAFRGHEKEVTSLAWHPQHENLFASGGADGSILFWDSERDESVGGMESAHDNGAVWSLAWHPLGHILASGSNDFSTRFWTRHRPGDIMRERYDMSRSEAESLGLLNAAFHDDGSWFGLTLDDEPAEKEAPSSYYINQSINMSGSGGGAIPGMGIGAQLKSTPGMVIPGLGGGKRPPVPQQRERGGDRGRERGSSGGFGAGGPPPAGFNANTAPIGQRSSYYGGQGGGEQRGGHGDQRSEQDDQRGGQGDQRGGRYGQNDGQDGGYQQDGYQGSGHQGGGRGGGYQGGGQRGGYQGGGQRGGYQGGGRGGYQGGGGSHQNYGGGNERSPPRGSPYQGGEPVAYGGQQPVQPQAPKPGQPAKSASDFYAK